MRAAASPTAIVVERLSNHKLTGSGLRQPDEIASWFAAVQAQDFSGAKWALGLRGRALTDAEVERAFNEGAILRTHVLRETWHFVAAGDIRWLVALSGPRILARMAFRHRQLEIDRATLAKSRAALSRALAFEDLTKREIGLVMRRARIPVTPERLSHLLMAAELEGVICSGPLRDRQFTYAPMERRAPATPAIDRDEGLARLALRYFRSHGPATIVDFAWWSGLSRGDARRAIEAAGARLDRDAVLAGTYSSRPARPRPGTGAENPAAWLLPSYDEYLVAYKDRTAVLGRGAIDPRDTLTQTVIVDGFAVATWRVQGQKPPAACVQVTRRRRITRDERSRIERAVERYGSFVGRSLDVAFR